MGRMESQGTQYKGISGADRAWAELGSQTAQNWAAKREEERLRQLELQETMRKEQAQLQLMNMQMGHSKLDEKGNLVSIDGKKGKSDLLNQRKQWLDEATAIHGDPQEAMLDPEEAQRRQFLVQQYLEDRGFEASGQDGVLNPEFLSDPYKEVWAKENGKKVAYQLPDGTTSSQPVEGAISFITDSSAKIKEKAMEVGKTESEGLSAAYKKLPKSMQELIPLVGGATVLKYWPQIMKGAGTGLKVAAKAAPDLIRGAVTGSAPLTSSVPGGGVSVAAQQGILAPTMAGRVGAAAGGIGKAALAGTLAGRYIGRNFGVDEMMQKVFRDMIMKNRQNSMAPGQFEDMKNTMANTPLRESAGYLPVSDYWNAWEGLK